MGASQKFQSIDDKHFKNNPWALTKGGDGSDALKSLSNILANQRARQRGVIPAERYTLGIVPTAGDHVDIGGVVFEFCTAASPLVPGNPAHVAVAIAGTIALTLANLINAINGVADAVNILYPQGANGPGGATYSYLNGAPAVVADNPTGNVLRIKHADFAGGTPIPGAALSTALAATVTGSANAWTATNLNLSFGKNLTDQDFSLIGPYTITAADITLGSIIVELPFAPAAIVGDTTAQQAVSIAGSTLTIAMVDAQANPFYVANDVISFLAVK